LEYRIVYDPTQFVQESVNAVYHTLFEAVILVLIVVLVFLQSWRATIIPLLAVPVSLIGTFGVMAALGFSLNNLSLFGLVLAIGIVVDDAIVVVENVERNIEEGLEPKAATRKAMDEVGGPVVAIAVVLSAVFIPSGITGQFYRHALTIAVSTLISAFNSLTLSPALAALLLKGKGAKPDLFTRVLDLVLGWFFRGFNSTFSATMTGYSRIVGRLLRLSVVVLPVYLAERENNAAQSATSILAAIRRQANQIPDALVLAFPPPPVQGIGNAGGFKLQIEDRRSAGLAALNEAANAVIAKARQQPGLAGLFTSYRYNVPQIHLDIDRRKAETLDVPVNSVFSALQTYLGSD
jgi:multidrug efflux pump subunit AcrB